MTSNRDSENGGHGTALWFGIAAVVLSTGLPWGLPSSVGIVGAARILAGEVPYRDFWTLYAPGHFYLLAVVRALVGPSLLGPAVAAVLLQAGTVAVLYRIARTLMLSVGSRRLLCLAATLLFWRGAPAVTTYQPALLLLALGWNAWIRIRPGSDLRGCSQAGVFFGLAAWFKHDVAAYSMLAGALHALLLPALTHGAWQEVPGKVARLSVGALATTAPVAALVLLAAGADAYQDLIRFPATDFATSRPESYPGFWPAETGLRGLLHWACHVSPVGWLAVGLVVLVRGRLRWSPARTSALLLFLLLLPLHWLAAHVQINTHIYTMALLSALIAATCATGRDHAGRGPARLRAALWVIPLLPLGYLPLMAAARIVAQWPYAQRIDSDVTRGFRLSERESRELEPVIRFVTTSTRPDERIYVGVARHDAIVTSRPMLYPLCQRLGATRYDELHPAIVDRLPAQEEIIAALELDRTRCVLLWAIGWTDERFDQIRDARRESLGDTGAERLDAYLRTRYREISRHGEMRILWREGEPAPDR